MGEMMDDAFDAIEEDGVEEEAAEEVDKVLYEITKGVCGGGASPFTVRRAARCGAGGRRALAGGRG